MRSLAAREHAPTLAYVAAGLFLLELVLGTVGAGPFLGALVTVLFVVVLALLVLGVESPHWAQLAGFGWAASLALGAILVVATSLMGVGGALVTAIGTLALAGGAVWVAGASLVDAGPGRALGIAAGAGMAASALLRLADVILITESPLIVRLVSTLTLALLVAWFVVLGRDLEAGRRHMGRPARVFG